MSEENKKIIEEITLNDINKIDVKSIKKRYSDITETVDEIEFNLNEIVFSNNKKKVRVMLWNNEVEYLKEQLDKIEGGKAGE